MVSNAMDMCLWIVVIMDNDDDGFTDMFSTSDAGKHVPHSVSVLESLAAHWITPAARPL